MSWHALTLGLWFLVTDIIVINIVMFSSHDQKCSCCCRCQISITVIDNVITDIDELFCPNVCAGQAGGGPRREPGGGSGRHHPLRHPHARPVPGCALCHLLHSCECHPQGGRHSQQGQVQAGVQLPCGKALQHQHVAFVAVCHRGR